MSPEVCWLSGSGSVCTVSTRERSRRRISGSSHSSEKRLTTLLSGIYCCRVWLQTSTLFR
jgi:hypothetical protein